MFEQLKENVSLARQSGKAARETYDAGREAFHRAEPIKRAVWVAVPASILVRAVAQHFSLSGYKIIALEFVLVVIPALVWVRQSMKSDGSAK